MGNEHNKYIDIHCHCLPGLDDGPLNNSEAVELCRSLVADGIGTVIATVHQLGRYDTTNNAAKIRDAVNAMNEQLRENDIDLCIMPGGDVRLDERIPLLLQTDNIMTLADGGLYLLLELPSEVFINIEPLLAELNDAGISTIISHPERCMALDKHPEILEKWLEQASLQITAGSLLGHFGQRAQQTGWSYLEKRQAQFVATDAHDRQKRYPCMNAAFDCIATKLGPDIAHEVCVENPRHILNGTHIINSIESNSPEYSYGGSNN